MNSFNRKIEIKNYTFPENNCAYHNDEMGVLLYQTDCIDFMQSLLEMYPEGIFDMIFADPPYFLSNGGTTCHSGKRVSVDKGDWDRCSDCLLYTSPSPRDS